MNKDNKSFIVLLLDLNISGSTKMDICIAEFQSKDALDFIPVLSCLGGLVDEYGVVAMSICLGQAHMALCYNVSSSFCVHEAVP